MKRPAFQFYPGDWLRSTDLRTCSLGARGLWIEMIVFMHEGDPYGYLRVGDKDILPPILAQMVGAPVSDVEIWLKELENAGIFSRKPAKTGCIYSRRMVRDERIRESRAKGGSQSSKNPNVPRKRISLQPSSPPSSDTSLDPSPASASALPTNKQGLNNLGKWWLTNEGIEATAKTLGLKAGQSETYDALKERCFDVINAKKKGNVSAKPEQSANAICSQCGGSLEYGWTSMSTGRACNPCYQRYLNGDTQAPEQPI